jgi:hypothetical protein
MSVPEIVEYVLKNVFNMDIRILYKEEMIDIRYRSCWGCINVSCTNSKYEMIGCCCLASLQNFLYTIFNDGAVLISNEVHNDNALPK